MKQFLILLALVATQAFAGPLDLRIVQLEAEIAQRQAAVEQLKAEGKPTGRFEMTVLRLRNELAKLKESNG